MQGPQQFLEQLYHLLIYSCLVGDFVVWLLRDYIQRHAPGHSLFFFLIEEGVILFS